MCTHFGESLHEFLGSDVREPLEFHVSQLLCQYSGWRAELGDVHLRGKITILDESLLVKIVLA